MNGPLLTVVPDQVDPVEVYNFSRGPETTTQRVQRLQREARQLAREQIEAMGRDLDDLAQRAREIAEGGDAYAVGVREMASRLAADLPQKSQSLLAILNRTAKD
jgi:predicted Zn-dependent protease